MSGEVSADGLAHVPLASPYIAPAVRTHVADVVKTCTESCRDTAHALLSLSVLVPAAPLVRFYYFYFFNYLFLFVF